MKRIIPILISSLLVLSSCNRTVFSEFQAVPAMGWAADSAFRFDYNIADSTDSYCILINVRHTETYPYQNMWLFVSDSLHEDTLEFYLADDRGRWLGNTHHGYIEMPVLYEEAYRFSAGGKKQLRIRHGMRDEVLHGVSDIGVIIEKNGKE